jgi:hypothetical protein
LIDLEIQILTKDLQINTDAVLRAQGADPAIIRSRSPYLVEIADQALANAQRWLEPKILSRQLEVKSIYHEKLELEGGISLSGSLVTQHLAASQSVIAILCTVGPKVEEYASMLMETNLLLGLAIDAVGSAGGQALANAVCRSIENRVAENCLKTTIPLSPGMIGWPVEEGQEFIFKLLEAKKIGVELTSHYLMIPRKTLSMLIGIGPEAGIKGYTCDYCNMNKMCRYQDHYRYVGN